MTERTHYVELGIAETATGTEIRTAYRRLVLVYHPDRSHDKATTERFVKISEAYRTLSDPKLRTEYDSGLRYRRDQAARRAEAPKPESRAQVTEERKPEQKTVGDEAARMQQAATFFSMGKYDRAESILNLVLRTTPRSALAYAMLGDIARQRGDLRNALTRYSYAVQFDPNNATYQRRYEELLEQSSKVSRTGFVEAKKPSGMPAAIAGLAIGLMAVVVSVGKPDPLVPDAAPISTFSFTYVLMLFLAGIATGVGAAAGGYVDRIRSLFTGASGKPTPFAILSALALGAFWIAALCYYLLGLSRDAFTYSASRLISVTAGLCLLFALCGWASGAIHPLQAVVWSGNVLWLGALCGWMMADGLR